MIIRKEQRAQAALIDSLFFIAIVSAICTGLFYFAINYGLSSESVLNSFYSSDFAMDSLKVITYINVMRDGSAVRINPADNVNPDSVQEYDYLLALLKEDFAQNKRIGFDSRKAIANTLYSVLKPFDDSIDYVFFIAKESYSSQESKFVALIIASRKKMDSSTGSGGEYCEPNVNGVNGECFFVKRVFYSCDPTNKGVLEKYIFPYVGKVDSAVGKISLSENTSSSTPYVIGLNTWVSKDINVMSNLDIAPDFNCVLIDGVPNLN